MKLWQKIFLWTLLTVMMAVSTIEILLLKNNFSATINEQTDNLISEHTYMLSNINNRIIATRLQSNSIILPRSTVINIMRSIFEASGTNSSTIVALFSEYKNILYNSSPIELDMNLLDTVIDKSGITLSASDTNEPNILISKNDPADSTCYTQILKLNNRTRLFVASIATFEQQNYIFVTSTDISEIYASYDEQLRYAKFLCIFLSLICAIILLALVKLLLRPLEYLNRSTHAIAGGDYSQRINADTNDELGMLANNMNIMADAVEKNVSQLKEVAENRKDFINNLSHEMKTPLTSILGFADIIRIKRNISPDELKDYSTIIFDEAKRLKNLSGKLMELITIGETNSELTEIDSVELFSQIELVMQPIMTTNDISLEMDCDRCLITVDLELFKSMIFNFIDNAVKASEKGSTIRISGEYDKGLFTISVIDNGIGIAEDEIKKIKEPFYMVDKARSRKSGGAGLGLALCQRIAEIHNSDIEIFSEQGKGTTIKISIKGAELNETTKNK